MAVERYIDAPADVVWRMLVDLDYWRRWGLSVNGATLDDGGRQLSAESTGRVKTVAGVELPFRITQFEPGRHWSWVVSGVRATTHRVTPEGTGCRVRFEAPCWAAPYLVVCAVALARIDRLATSR